MPKTELAALPSIFDSWQDWRDTYEAYAKEFQQSDKSAAREIDLRRSLRRLGYTGLEIDAELAHIKENS